MKHNAKLGLHFERFVHFVYFGNQTIPQNSTFFVLIPNKMSYSCFASNNSQQSHQFRIKFVICSNSVENAITILLHPQKKKYIVVHRITGKVFATVRHFFD